MAVGQRQELRRSEAALRQWRLLESAPPCYQANPSHGFEEESAAMTDLPLCLKRAGQEVLLALGAETDDDERYHRALADRLTAQALRDLERAPDKPHDWSLLAPAG
jgi:hypothetical protein